jgi:hypothetical protein
LLIRGGSKSVFRCIYSKAPAAYYLYLDGETALKEAEEAKKEFEREVTALANPALVQHPNILKVFAVCLFVFCLLLTLNVFCPIKGAFR